MTEQQIDITGDGSGTYDVTMQAFDGAVTRTLFMEGAEEASNGAFGEDEEAALAVVKFLLTHQDASQLPLQVEVGDVIAAYDNAVGEISKNL